MIAFQPGNQLGKIAQYGFVRKNKSFEKNVYKENKAIKYSLIFVSIISIIEFIGLIYLIRKKSIL